MYKSNKAVVAMMCAVLFVGVVAGFAMARDSSPVVKAHEENNSSKDENNSGKADHDTLEQIYQSAFGRPVDEDGEKFHRGKNIKQVLRDINNSDEHRYYSALFKAVKAYEEAVRAPGDMSAEDKQRYLNNIDSALSTLLAWVATLPSQDICKGVVGAEEARQAIHDAYEKMSPEAKEVAKKGLFKALENLGRPHDLPLPSHRCLVRPTPTVVACTQEVKLCPDGSSVGRTGPKCEFKACPPSPTPSPTASPSPTPTPAQ